MAELVLDVGMHDCEDTAYYLECGYDVVAIDANPAKCALAERRFAPEISSERLQVLNMGIADQAGEMGFWVSEESEWSSFDRAAATRQGRGAVAVQVPTVAFGEVLGRYRAPLFVKVDIEGNDTLCVRELANSQVRPKYVSFEAHPGACEDIALLSGVGYASFKCVRQNDLREIAPLNVRWQVEVRKVVWRAQHGSRAHYRRRRLAGRRFPEGSSGPMPWAFPGRWGSAEQVQAVWQRMLEVDRELGCNGLGEWFDIHVRREPA
ncbi:MAG: FkbM family methyltransferase [Acidimicrobiales bacterium]